jgi:hypothetical protein
MKTQASYSYVIPVERFTKLFDTASAKRKFEKLLDDGWESKDEIYEVLKELFRRLKFPPMDGDILISDEEQAPELQDESTCGMFACFATETLFLMFDRPAYTEMVNRGVKPELRLWTTFAY